MTKPLSSHLRDDGSERISEMLDATTYNRVTVLYCDLRGGHQRIALRCISDNPRRFRIGRLNEHGAVMDNRDVDIQKARSIVQIIRESAEFVGYERGDVEDLWPGQPNHKHPKWSGGEHQ